MGSDPIPGKLALPWNSKHTFHSLAYKIIQPIKVQWPSMPQGPSHFLRWPLCPGVALTSSLPALPMKMCILLFYQVNSFCLSLAPLNSFLCKATWQSVLWLLRVPGCDISLSYNKAAHLTWKFLCETTTLNVIINISSHSQALSSFILEVRVYNGTMYYAFYIALHTSLLFQSI